MKQLATLLATLLLLASAVQAQDRYYYSDERKIPIEQAERWKVIQVPESAQAALTRALARRPDIGLRRALDPERGFYWLESKGQQTLSTATLDRLSQQVPVQRIIPAFFRTQDGDTTHFVMTDEFRVRFKPGVTRAEIDALNARYGVEVLLEDEQDRRQVREYNEYQLRVTEASDLNALEAANLYYENPLTVWSLPNFYINYQPVDTRLLPSIDDPLFNDQWHLKNTGQGGGTVGVDIEAVPAWNITTGSSSITVAVIDDGVEAHEDFYSGQLVNGYTAGGGDGSPGPGDAHGQAVAGIIAANPNSTGVRGVAPNVKIMSIKILYAGATAGEIADAIDWAWQNGADVLNNSWAGPSNDDIADALTHARQNGRNGKGAAVVAAAGNTGSYVTFPATVPGVLTVGAVTNTNQPASYTPRDSNVDIVAPSSGGTLGITTTDRMGNAGYNSGNYEDSFGGTSAAAPQASGVAALILSLDPSLTESQVRSMIRNTADDYGSTNWDGMGRLNAHEALPPPSARITSGPSRLNEGEWGTWTASISGNPTTIGWQKRLCPTCTWYGACSGSLTCTTSFNDDSTYDMAGQLIRVIAANSAGSDSDEAYVFVKNVGDTGGGGGGDPPPDDCYVVTGEPGTNVPEPPCPYALTAQQPVPETFALGGNAPNPFSGQTTIHFALPEAAQVELVVYDMMGRRVATPVDQQMKAGYHEASFRAQGLPSGVYLYRFTAGDKFADTGRMVVVR